jgi:4-amino-4-deoxy-L-arabinose transferase-like glycosyltransferase
MGQALLVVPGLGLMYLSAAPVSPVRRVRDLLGAGVAMVAGGGWWVAAVELWPASDRPWIGGSTTNSVLELAFGYNGLGRLFGGTGNGGGGGGGASFAGSPGITRLFSASSGMATEISWLLPSALVALVAGLWLTRRAPRTDASRALLLGLGGWLLVTGLVFSFMEGTIHPYYAVALAPAIAGIVAVTAALLWQRRGSTSARVLAAVLVEVTALWDAHLLAPTPTFLPWLPAVLVVVGTLAAAALPAAGFVTGARVRRVVAVGVLASVLTGLAGSGAYAVSTAAQAHTGSMPSAGPVATSGVGGTGRGGPPAAPSGGTTAPGGGTASAGSAVVALLQATGTRWSAATVGSQSAAPLQLASGTAVMAVGGFNGSDDAPTLAQFEAWVAAGQIRYFVAGSDGAAGHGGSTGAAAEITAWVQQHYSSTTVDGYTVYDLTTAS